MRNGRPNRRLDAVERTPSETVTAKRGVDLEIRRQSPIHPFAPDTSQTDAEHDRRNGDQQCPSSGGGRQRAKNGRRGDRPIVPSNKRRARCLGMTRAADEKLDEVVKADEASPIGNRAEGQRDTSIDQAYQPLDVSSGSGAVDKGWTDNHHLQARPRAELA